MSGRNGTALDTRPNVTNGGSLPNPFPQGEAPVQVGGAQATTVAGGADLSELEALRRAVSEQPEMIELRRKLLSPEEQEEEAKLAQFEREQLRDGRRRQILANAKLEQEQVDRDQRRRTLISRNELKRAYSVANMAEWRARAAEQAEQLTSKDMRVAQLARQLSWTKRLLVTLVVAGMTWSGINVQKNLVPGGSIADPMFWISYVVDALLLGALVVLMLTSATLARWEQDDDRQNGRLGRAGGYVLEVGLTLVSLGLNTIPQIAHQNWGRAFEYAVAPLAVAVLLWVYNWSTRVLSTTLARAMSAATLQLNEHGLLILDYAMKAFEAMKRGELQASQDADGGGAPAAGQLARWASISKATAGEVRDRMKQLSEGPLELTA